MRALIIGFTVLAASCSAGAQAPSSGAPDWMSGYWLSCEDGTQTAENWIGAGSGVLVGVNLAPAGERTSYEFLRVSSNASGGLSYYSMPNGRSPATEFAMTSHVGQRVVFSNPTHDFPQRVIYARTGDTMTARIEGEIEGRTEHMDWTFRRAEIDQTCR